jgi:ABC-2 type transport system permease protein
MALALGHGDVPQLGLVIPADFDQQLETGEPVELEGYVLHWVTASETSEVKAQVEGVIADALGQPVSIYIGGNAVYAPPDGGGRAFLVSLLLVITTTLMGVVIIPHLMIEERQAKTMDVLLVSPASIGQVVVGKALTGLFYCLIGAVVVLGWNATLVVHWWLAILATVCGALMTVALGLLFGSIFRVKQQMTLWGFVTMNVLLVPMFLAIMEDLLPRGLIAALRWVPTAALAQVLRVSFSQTAPAGQFAPELALVLGCAAAILVVVVWVVRRSDR